jgi:hypothetical protein
MVVIYYNNVSDDDSDDDSAFTEHPVRSNCLAFSSHLGNNRPSLGNNRPITQICRDYRDGRLFSS